MSSLAVFPQWQQAQSWGNALKAPPEETYAGQQVGDVKILAQQVQQATGEDIEDVLAHWIAENGSSIITNSGIRNVPGNNLGNITPGNPFVDNLSNGTIVENTSQGKRTFDSFPNIETGAEAYAYMIAKDPNYSGIRAAIATGDKAQVAQAIQDSPWGTTNMVSVFNSLEAANKQAKTGEGGAYSHDYISSTLNVAGDGVNTVSNIASGINTAGGVIPYINSLPWIRILIVVLGSVLVLLTLYKIATK